MIVIPAVQPEKTPGLTFRYDVFSLWAFTAVYHVHGDGLAFLKRLMAFSLYGTVVNENVFAAFTRNEAETFGVVEPLYCATNGI